ncbi:unnamed protein product, partial [Brassica rapa subsp. trilocularis]
MKAAVVTGKSSPEVSIREIRISQHDEFEATFVVLIHLQAMLKIDPQICLRKKPAPTHDETKSGTALSPPLSFFHTEIAYDSFTVEEKACWNNNGQL